MNKEHEDMLILLAQQVLIYNVVIQKMSLAKPIVSFVYSIVNWSPIESAWLP